VKCVRCKEERATVHVINIGAQGITDLHFCSECALETGYVPEQPAVSFEQVVSRLMSDSAEVQKPEPAEEPEAPACPDCGTKEADIPVRGVGCENDYKMFREAILKEAIKSHGCDRHTGKKNTPLGEKARQQQMLAALERQLAEAIKSENYEMAAEIRDRIRRGK
jgi:protein arginine kinase activator